MAEVTTPILKVDTTEAVKNVNDLKNNIKILKSRLGELTIGETDYQKTLNELVVNQNALKDAMYATSVKMEDVTASAKGTSQSYNALVHQMAKLKTEWRATNDEAERSRLGSQIAEINQQLKTMDASVGNFQRNVGNYQSATTGLVDKFNEWGATLKDLPPTLGSTKESLGKVGQTMQLIGKQPVLTIIGLLAPTIMRITDALKDNETAMDAVKKVMASLQPVFDLLGAVLEKVAQGVANVAEWFVNLMGESGETFKNIISGAVGVGNVLFQFLLTPIRNAIAAFKGLGKIIGDVFKGNFKDIKQDAEEAWGGIKDSFVKAFSFKENFDLGKRVGDEFAAGLGAAKPQVEQKAEELAKTIEEQLKKVDLGKIDSTMDKGIAAEKAARDEAIKQQKELDDLIASDMEETNAIVDEIFNDMVDKDLEVKKSAEDMAQARIASLFSLADATSSVLGSLANMYEADEENAEKNAKKIKALRIAEATINTISGAIGAFMQSAASLPAPYGVIVGAAQAAAVTAAGIAQIAKLKSTKMSSSGEASAPTAGAVVAAPNVDTTLQSVRNVTSASEEERLNQMAKDQRVYIVSSDIEAALDDNKTRVEESSF